MKFSLRFYKKVGTLLMVLGVVMLGYLNKSDSLGYYEVLTRCGGAVIFIVGGTTLVYANEKENQDQNQETDHSF